MAELDLLPKYDYSAFAELVNSANRQQSTLSFVEETLSKQNNSLANSKSGTQEYMTNFTTSPSLLEQKYNQYFETEKEFRKTLGEAHQKRQEEIMAKAVKFTLQEQARATGQTDTFLDPFFSDIDISKLSNLQNYNNVIESKRLEFIRDGYEKPEEIDNKVHEYLSNRVSPMVADILFDKTESTDPRQRAIINEWLNAESTISTAIPELVDVLLGKERETAISGLKGKSTLDIFLPMSEEERIAQTKAGLAVGEIGFGLVTLPFLTGSTALSGIVGAIDISMGAPAALRGKDPLQELVLGTERADDLNWWQRALYAVPGLAGLKPTVKATGRLQKAIFGTLSNKHGAKQAEQIISNGRASTELALSRIVGSPEWDELKTLSVTGRWKEGQLGLADQLELSDMIEEIEKGTGRLSNELLIAHGRANNPLQNIAQKAALGDRVAIQNIYNLVKRANDIPNESIRITGDINPFTILNDFRSVETRNVSKEIVENMNVSKPSNTPRKDATNMFDDDIEDIIPITKQTRDSFIPSGYKPEPYKVSPANTIKKIDSIGAGTFKGNELDKSFHNNADVFTNGKDVTNWISKNSDNESYKIIAGKISSKLKEVPFNNVKPNKKIKSGIPKDLLVSKAAALIHKGTFKRGIFIKSIDFGNDAPKIDEVLHECIHSATQEELLKASNKNSDKHYLFKELENLRTSSLEMYRKSVQDQFGGFSYMDTRLVKSLADTSAFRFGFDDPYEFIAYGLSDKGFQEFLKTIKTDSGSIFTEFVNLLKRALGISESESNALTRLIELSEGFM